MLKIHSYETFATQDGPGIRVVFFLQGCNFHCQYCQNPDTISLVGGREYSQEEIFSIIEKEKVYFGENGGVTFSGGNPLVQAQDLAEVLQFLKEKNIHTCIDTNGFFLTDEVKKCVEYADLFLPDLKQIDDKKHQLLTGMSNQMPLDFIRYLDEQKKAYWIRYVVLPGYTDDEKDVEKVGLFLQSLSTFQRIELLPYHTLGKYKRDQLGWKYPLEGKPSCTQEELLRVKEILSQYIEREKIMMR